MSYLDKLRATSEAAREQAQANSPGRPENEWVPGDVATRVRFLPISGDDYFYVTHSFNYLEKARDDGKDIKLFSTKKVIKDGVEVANPIDELVSKLYDMKTEGEKTIAGKIKRKRNFYFNAIVYEEGKEPALKVVIDSSADGKLTRKLCTVMGVPFCKDTGNTGGQQAWFPDKDWKFDPEQSYFDLVDTKEGFDFKIKKTVTGTNAWDFDYDASFVISQKGPRALTKAELELAKGAVDLKNYVTYETDYEKVSNYLNAFLAKVGAIKEDVKNKKTKAATPQPIQEDSEELDEEDLRAQLLED